MLLRTELESFMSISIILRCIYKDNNSPYDLAIIKYETYGVNSYSLFEYSYRIYNMIILKSMYSIVLH